MERVRLIRYPRLEPQCNGNESYWKDKVYREYSASEGRHLRLINNSWCETYLYYASRVYVVSYKGIDGIEGILGVYGQVDGDMLDDIIRFITEDDINAPFRSTLWTDEYYNMDNGIVEGLKRFKNLLFHYIKNNPSRPILLGDYELKVTPTRFR